MRGRIADRRRPHAQPPDDRPLADGAHRGHPRGPSRTARCTTASAAWSRFPRGRRHRLLTEVQRIKAEGDYTAARALMETYGVHFDRSAPRRDRRPCRAPGDAVLYRLRHAQAGARSRRVWRPLRSTWRSGTRATSPPRCSSTLTQTRHRARGDAEVDSRGAAAIAGCELRRRRFRASSSSSGHPTSSIAYRAPPVRFSRRVVLQTSSQMR